MPDDIGGASAVWDLSGSRINVSATEPLGGATELAVADTGDTRRSGLL